MSDPVHTYCAALTEAAAKVVEQSTMHESDRIVIAVRLRGFQQEYDRLRTALAASQKTVKVLGEECRVSRVHLVAAPHPDQDAPPTCPYFELNTHASQADDCNLADARTATNADPDARRAVEGPA